jgi:large subunit ribosomal protein L9
MEIILLKDIDKVGDKHDIVSVKAGYARNFLIPQGAAIVANSPNKAKLAELIRVEDEKEAAMLDDYRAIAAQLQGITLRIGAKTGTSGKIFGSVTALQLSQVLKEEHGLEIERKKIAIAEEVKTVGEYEAEIKLHKEVVTTVKFEVVAE